MSDDFSDLTPLPVEPLIEEPMPVQPMYEHFRAGSGRPGVIGFIGISSIVVGSLAILAGLCFGMMNAGLMMASSIATSVATAPPTTPAQLGANPGASPERLPANGLPAADRQNVADALSRLAVLSPRQLLQLDELLAEEGTTILPIATTFTPTQLAAAVSRSGHRTVSGAACDYFVLGQGRLEIYDDRAVFFPADGQPALRSNAIELPSTTAVSSSLQPQQIRSVLRTINDLNGGKIKSAQTRALLSTFQTPGQQIVIPTTDASDPAWEISTVSTSAEGLLSINTAHGNTFGSISCDAAGNVGQSAMSSNVASFTGPKVNIRASTTSLILTLLQLFLAVYLLVIGILTLRKNPRGKTLHWIYVCLKIPLAAAAAAASAWMWTGFMNSMPNGNAAGTRSAMMTASLSMGVTPAVVGCLYAIVLICLLLSGTVRSHYRQMNAPEG